MRCSKDKRVCGGEGMNPSIECPYCGKRIDDGWRYCPVCKNCLVCD